MKILYSNPTLLMKRPVSQIAERMSKEHEVSVLTPRKAFREREAKLHHSDLEEINVIDYPTISPPIAWEWPIPGPFFLVKAWKLLKQNDVIHMWVPFYKANSILAFMKKVFFPKKKLILTMDTIPGFSFSMGKLTDALFGIYYKTFGKIVFSAADTITLYGDSMKKFAEKAGVPMDKVRVIPTGIDSKAKKKDKDIRKEFGILKKSKIVLFVGLMNPRKGVDTIIKTAERIDATFILVGDGPDKEEFEELARKRGVSDKVIFTGFRKDVHNFYSEADVLFFPSRGEGLAGVIMESMVYGVPVVTSKIPCSTDLIKDGENGFTCEMEDIDCYAKRLKQLLASKKKREEFAKKSKLKIKKYYTWEKALKVFEELY